MVFSVRTTVDPELSVDPSYIIKYQIYEDGKFIGDGVTQYHRFAEKNNIHIPDTIVTLNNKPLSEKTKNKIVNNIHSSALTFFSQKLSQ